MNSITSTSAIQLQPYGDVLSTVAYHSSDNGVDLSRKIWKLESLPVWDLVALLKLHGITQSRAVSSDNLKCALVGHLLTGSCCVQWEHYAGCRIFYQHVEVIYREPYDDWEIWHCVALTDMLRGCCCVVQYQYYPTTSTALCLVMILGRSCRNELQSYVAIVVEPRLCAYREKISKVKGIIL